MEILNYIIGLIRVFVIVTLGGKMKPNGIVPGKVILIPIGKK